MILNDALDEGKRVLFEGAQGVMLDIDQGTYPFVTSSNPVAGESLLVVVWALQNQQSRWCLQSLHLSGRDGPFPTELFDETGEQIRKIGREYGTTTGRPRRVGWFDTVVMRHSNGFQGSRTYPLTRSMS